MEKCICACGYTQGAVYFRVCKFTILCDFPYGEKCISTCGFTQGTVNYRMRRYQALFNVNFLMRKIVFPRMRICTVLSELPLVKYTFPHVEIHIRWLHFNMQKYTKNCEFPNMWKYSFLVYFHMQKFKRESDFPHVNLQADS